MLYLFSSFRTMDIHYKLEIQIADTTRCPCHSMISRGVDFNFYLQQPIVYSILNDSNDLFNQFKGILPFRTDKQLVKLFIPTFLLFDFMIKNQQVTKKIRLAAIIAAIIDETADKTVDVVDIGCRRASLKSSDYYWPEPVDLRATGHRVVPLRN